MSETIAQLENLAKAARSRAVEADREAKRLENAVKVAKGQPLRKRRRARKTNKSEVTSPGEAAVTSPVGEE